jgi:hypothetical protein
MEVGIEFTVVSVAQTVPSICSVREREEKRMSCHVIRYCKNGLGVHVLSSQGTEKRGSGKRRQKTNPDCFSNESFRRETSVMDWISSSRSSDLLRK